MSRSTPSKKEGKYEKWTAVAPCCLSLMRPQYDGHMQYCKCGMRFYDWTPLYYRSNGLLWPLDFYKYKIILPRILAGQGFPSRTMAPRYYLDDNGKVKLEKSK